MNYIHFYRWFTSIYGPLSYETLADFPRFLKEEIPGLVEQGYEGDMPSMKVGRSIFCGAELREKHGDNHGRTWKQVTLW